MRLELGLDLPERRIGLTAHDFAQLLGAREVILSHAAKIAGTPTVPSRFIQRLAAVAGTRWQAAVARGDTYLAWARELDRPERPVPAPQPAPKPPRAARPNSLSVTEIEDWLRDPYTIYAKHVLRLRSLDAVDTEPGAAERGTIIHAAIGDFTQNFANSMPADPVRELIALGEPHFAALEDFPEARAFWWPRFVRIAHWFARWEAERRAAIASHRRRNPRRDRHPARRRHIQASRHRRPHRARRRTAAMSSSITRPAPRAAKSRCAPGWRRSSRWKPRSCAAAALRIFRPAPRSPKSPM